MRPPHLPPPGGGDEKAESTTTTGNGPANGQGVVDDILDDSSNRGAVLAAVAIRNDNGAKGAVEPGGSIFSGQAVSPASEVTGHGDSESTTPHHPVEPSSRHAQQKQAVTVKGPPDTREASSTIRGAEDPNDRAGGSVAATQPAQTGKSPGAQAPIPLHATSAEMFTALVEDMIDSPNVGQVDAWCTTVRQLFADIYKTVPCKAEALPTERKRFPTLSVAETASLLGLFEQVFVKGKGSFAEWKIMAKAITHELLTTKWAFKEIIRRLASKHKWAHAPVLNQWTQVVQHGESLPRRQPERASSQTFDDFMFNPEKFTCAEIERFKAMCAAPAAPAGHHQVRAGTDDEWAIIVGLVEGTVACRRMPAFIKQVLKSEERLRLYSTIQAQVEGELVLRLDKSRAVKANRQTTKAITEAILESAELARINLHALHRMLSQTKTISYDQVTKSIHFYFFTRETAEHHKEVRVPYYGGVYQLVNAHRPEKGSVWLRQKGLNGTPTGRRVEYTVQLHNLTRFNDIGRIAAYLKAKIPTEFDMEDMDTHTPDSRTSTIWRVTFKLAGCPTFLNGVVRVLWFGTTIIVKHPNVGHRIQCLQCGNLGHTLARCRFTDDQLQGPGGIVVTEADVLDLADLAKPFSSIAEIKAMAVQRLKLQKEAEGAAQAAVTPTRAVDVTETSPGHTLPVVHGTSSAPQAEQGAKYVHLQPEPSPPAQQPWLTKADKGGRSQSQWVKKMVATAASASTSGVYQVLMEDDDESEGKVDTKRNSVAKPLKSPVVDLTTESNKGHGHTERSRLSSDDKHRKSAATMRGPAPAATGPVILTHKKKERKTFQKLVTGETVTKFPSLPMGARSTTSPATLAEVEVQLGVRSVVTPATGNCMAMAIVQAAADATLDGPGNTLELLTASLKRGIKFSGLLDLEGQLAHDHRVQALANVKRGWTSMTRQESATQMRWFLEDFANSSSNRAVEVSDDTWGGSDTVGMAANFLQRKIYILQQSDGPKQGWQCKKFIPTTITRNRRVLETAAEYTLSLMDLIDEVVAAKIENPGQPPLLLHFWGRHYSALLHTGRTRQLPDFAEEVECKTPVSTEDLPAVTHANSSKPHLALRTAPVDAPMEDPWDPDSWNGTPDAAWAALQGCSVHPDLHHDLHVLFRIDEPTRSRDLIKGVVTAAMTMALPAQQQFAAVLRGAEGEEAELALTQRMQITKERLRLWQCQLQAAGHMALNLDRRCFPPAREIAGLLTNGNGPHDMSNTSRTSVGECQALVQHQPTVGQDFSSLGVHEVLPALPTTPPAGVRDTSDGARKRGHLASPDERIVTGTVVRHQHNDAILKKGRHDTITSQITNVDASERIDRDDWAATWETLAQGWSHPAHIPFPTAQSSTIEWQRVARHASDLLLWHVKRFVFPGELLQMLDVSVFEHWMTDSRLSCLTDGLKTYRKQLKDQPTQAWIDQWIANTQHRSHHTKLAPLVDNADDWKLLRAHNYAGDDVLKLCDPQRKTRLSQHLLCALLYDTEIAALVKGAPTAKRVSDKLRSHIQLIITNGRYKEAYYSPTKSANWVAIERFFCSGLTHTEEASLIEY